MSRGAGGGAPHIQLGFQAARKWFSTRSLPGGENKPQSTPSARPWVPNVGQAWEVYVPCAPWASPRSQIPYAYGCPTNITTDHLALRLPCYLPQGAGLKGHYLPNP